MGPINKIPLLVQIMAWHRPGDKPLSQPMMAYFVDRYMSLGLNELNDYANLKHILAVVL